MSDSIEKEDSCTLDKPSKMSDQTRQKLMLAGALVIAALVSIIFIRSTGTHELAKAAPEGITLGMDDDLLSDDVYEDFSAGLKQQDEVIKSQAQQILEQEEQQAIMKKEMESFSDLLDRIKEGNLPTSQNNIAIPEGLTANSFNSFPPPSAGQNKSATVNSMPSNAANVTASMNSISNITESEWIGGIDWEEGAPVTTTSKKKELQEFYMPPSFFGAKLLSGIDAMTNKEAKSHPETVMLMVDAPAVLPNHIKKNLKGCYVVANATGNLAKERVQLQVVSLSCLSPDGSAVIDERVLGYVADSDGKRDLKGNVVARQGSNTALMFVASAVGALGNQASLSTITQTTSASNGAVTQTIEPGDALKHSLGNAAKDSSVEYKNILIDYIKQASPVIEIGALKDATVFIQKGVWLKIRSTQDSSSNENT